MNIDALAKTARAVLLRRLQIKFQVQGLAAETLEMENETTIRFSGHSFHAEYGTRTTPPDPKVRRTIAELMKE